MRVKIPRFIIYKVFKVFCQPIGSKILHMTARSSLNAPLPIQDWLAATDFLQGSTVI